MYYDPQEALECVQFAAGHVWRSLMLMMPGIDGFTLLSRIREKYFFPVIMLTAKDTDIDKIQGLTLGADDYITKPFNPLEVVARVRPSSAV